MDIGRFYDARRQNVRNAIEECDAGALQRALHEVPALRVYACRFLSSRMQKSENSAKDPASVTAFMAMILAVLELCSGNSDEENFCIRSLTHVFRHGHSEVLVGVVDHIMAKEKLGNGCHRFLLSIREMLTNLAQSYENDADEMPHVDVFLQLTKSESLREGGDVAYRCSQIATCQSSELAQEKYPSMFISQSSWGKRDEKSKPRLFVADHAAFSKAKRACHQFDEDLAAASDDGDISVWSQLLMLYLVCPGAVIEALRKHKASHFLSELVTRYFNGSDRERPKEDLSISMYLRILTCILMGHLLDVEGEIPKLTLLKDAPRLPCDDMEDRKQNVGDRANNPSFIETHIRFFSEQCLTTTATGAVAIYDAKVLISDVVRLSLRSEKQSFTPFLWRQTWIPLTELKNAICTQLTTGEYCLESVVSLWSGSIGSDENHSQASIADQVMTSVLARDDILPILLARCKFASLAAKSSCARGHTEVKKRRVERPSRDSGLLRLLLSLECAARRAGEYPKSFWLDLLRVLHVAECRYLWEVFHAPEQPESGLVTYREECTQSIASIREALTRHRVSEDYRKGTIGVCACGAAKISAENEQTNSSAGACVCCSPQWTHFGRPGVYNWCLWSSISSCSNSEETVREDSSERAAMQQKVLLNDSEANGMHANWRGELFRTITQAVLRASVTRHGSALGISRLCTEVRSLLQTLTSETTAHHGENIFQQLEACIEAEFLQKREHDPSAESILKSQAKRIRTALELVWKEFICLLAQRVHRTTDAVIRDIRSAENVLRMLLPSLEDIENDANDMPSFVEAAVKLATLLPGGGKEIPKELLFFGILKSRRFETHLPFSPDNGHGSLVDQIQRCFLLDDT